MAYTYIYFFLGLFLCWLIWNGEKETFNYKQPGNHVLDCNTFCENRSKFQNLFFV